MSKTDPKGRARKAEVWAGIPRKGRRMMQTAGYREAARRFLNPSDAVAAFHRLDKSAAMARPMAPKYPAGVVTGRVSSTNPPLTKPPQDGFHEAIAAPAGKAPPVIDPLRAKRSEAAKRAAATRKANAAAKQ